MNNIFKIYKDDIKKIFTNYAALIVFIALSILPSLYAWFNIKASWDPYGKEATSQIKIGVVNKDKGAELKGEFNETAVGYIHIFNKRLEEKLREQGIEYDKEKLEHKQID